MDHHDDDWGHWSEEHGFEDAETADLSDAAPGDLPGGHDPLDEAFPESHEDTYEPGDGDYPHPAEPGPDLLHEGGDNQPVEHPADDLFDAPDHDPGHDPGHDPVEPPADEAHEPPPVDDPVDHPVDDHPVDDHPGADHLAFADPDLAGDHDAGYHDGDFPPPLDLGHPPPEPMDGYPWSDPATLGEPPADAPGFDHASYADATPTPDDLFAYSGMDTPAGGDLWSALLGSDDPATSSLARWWGPAA